MDDILKRVRRAVRSNQCVLTLPKSTCARDVEPAVITGRIIATQKDFANVGAEIYTLQGRGDSGKWLTLRIRCHGGDNVALISVASGQEDADAGL